MKGTLVSWYKFIVNQIVLMAFIFSSALPVGAFAQSSTPTPAPVMTADTNGGYVASEKFRNDKQEEEKGYQQGVIEMITTVILTLIMAVAPMPKRTDVSKNDCKQNIYGPITVAIAKAAAIIYIIAEIVNHAQFKETGEAIKEVQVDNAADAGAQEKGSAKEKDKQLTSFNRLKGLYENEKRLLDQKLFAQGMMTTMFATALGVEIGGMISCKATCVGTFATAKYAGTAALTAITTANSSGLASACAGPQAVALCGQCTAFVGVSGGIILKEGAWLTSLTPKGLLFISKKTAKSLKESKEAIGALQSLTQSTYAAGEKVANDIGSKIANSCGDEVQEQVVADKNSVQKKLNEETKKLDLNALDSFQACPFAAASIQLHKAYIEAIKKVPVICCGTEIGQGTPNLLTPDLPIPLGIAHRQRDLKEPKDTETKLKKFLGKMKKAFSAGKQAVKATTETSFLSPAEASALATQSEFYVKLDQYLKNNKKSKKKLTMNDHMKFQKFVENFYSKENLKKFDPIVSEARKNKDPYMQKLVTLLDAVLVADANAGVVDDVISSPILQVMMMTGTGAMLFKKIIQKFYDKWGQKAPINRTIMWGFLTTLAFTVTVKTKQMQNDIDDRAAHVEQEKQKFIAATGLNNELEDKQKGPQITDPNDPKFKKKTSTTDKTDIKNSCYTEEGADPSCSCKGSNSCLDFPNHDISGLGLPSMYTANISGANQMANQMGQGKFESAMLGGVGTFGKDGLGGYNTLKRKNKELQDKLNSMRKASKQEPIDFDGMVKDLSNGIAALTNATLAKDLGGGTMGPLASTGPTDLDNKSKSSPSASVAYEGAAMTSPGAPAPAAGSLLGEESLVTEELPMDDSLKPDEQSQALNNYDLDNNDITKTDENLFKILSSRYLRAYPKLLQLDEPAKDPKKANPANAPK
jgi:hypothetical protein